MLKKLIARVLLFALATAVTTTAIPLMYGTDEWSAANTEAPPSSEFRCKRVPNRTSDYLQVWRSQGRFLGLNESHAEETRPPLSTGQASRTPATLTSEAAPEIANRPGKPSRLIRAGRPINGEAVG